MKIRLVFLKEFYSIVNCAETGKKILINARFTARQFNMYLKDMSYTQVQYSENQFRLIQQDLHLLPSLPLFTQISLYQDKRSVN